MLADWKKYKHQSMRAPRIRCRPSVRLVVAILLLAACAAYCYYSLPFYRNTVLESLQVESEIKLRPLQYGAEKKHIVGIGDVGDGDGGGEGSNGAQNQCPLLFQSVADIDTVTTFPTFDFQPSWMHTLEFWDDSFEARYVKSLNDSSRPPLEVIVVPHSHTDPGWLMTFHQYSEQKTRDILDSTLYQLKQHKDLTFIWTEIAFLNEWWETAHPIDQKAFRKLVKRGQLEIMTGGWVMPDEACTHYYSLVDQLLEGHMWVKDKLGVAPKSGWSIDPFGHGPTVPYLLERAGITGAIIQRIHYAWKQYFAKNQIEDFHWLPGFETNVQNRLLVHNMPFDIYSIQNSCGPHSSVCIQFDFALNHVVESTRANSEDLYAEYARTGSLTQHNVVLIPLGDDFRYKSIAEFEAQYSNYNRLFEDIRRKHGDRVRIRFGTPRDYFEAVRARTKETQTLRGDMFVYSDIFSEGRPAYWSGYFTTRPAIKLLARYLMHHLRVAHILYTYVYNLNKQLPHPNMTEKTWHSLDKAHERLIGASRNLALFQHHDAITGTSKAFVMYDYGTRLVASLYESQRVQELAMSALMTSRREVQSVELWDRYGGMPRRQRLSLSERDRVIVLNPVMQPRVELVHLTVDSPHLTVTNLATGNRVPHQVNPVFVPGRQNWISNDTFDLMFVVELPPLAAVTFLIELTDNTLERTTVFCEGCGSSRNGEGEVHFDMKPLIAADIRLENSELELVVDRNTGFLRLIRRKDTNEKYRLQIEYGAYRSAQRSSGAYLFKPDYSAPERDVLSNYEANSHIRIVSGPIATELNTLYPPLLTHTLRIYHVDEKGLGRGVQLLTSLNLEPPPRNRETEMFMRLHSNIDNGLAPVMYTDQNGFQYQKRVKVNSLGIEANYYPVTTAAWIEDAELRLSLLTGHAQGAASANVGQLEVMLDRRTLYDDRRGMGEGVVDNVPTDMKHWLLIETPPDQAEPREYRSPTLLAERLSRSLQFPPVVYTVEKDIEEVEVQYSLAYHLPPGLHLMSLRVLGEFPSSSALMTLHRPAPASPPNATDGWCPAVNTNMKFERLKIKHIAEVSLTGLYTYKNLTSLRDINLEPMEIKSYQIWF